MYLDIDFECLELWGKVALLAIQEYTNSLNNGLTNKVVNGINLGIDSIKYIKAMGHAMFHDSVCELYPEYIGTKEYEKNLELISKYTVDFISSATETTLDTISDNNYSKIKLFYDFIDLNFKDNNNGKSLSQTLKEGIKDSILGKAHAGDFGDDFKQKINKDISSTTAKTSTSTKSKKFVEKEYEKSIDKTKLNDEEKTKLKENPDKLKEIIQEKVNKVTGEFNDKSKFGGLTIKEKREFVQTIGELGETSYLIGSLTNSKDLISTGVIAMNTCKIASNVLIAMDSGLKLANVNGILGGILVLSSFFGSKSSPYTAIMAGIRGIQDMLQNIHQDMINNFIKVYKELGEIITSIIINFKKLDLDMNVIFEKLNLISSQITHIDNKLTDIHTDISEKFKSLSERITLDDVSTKRTQFISKITNIQCRDKDMFEESMRDLLTLISVEDETLSGFKDINNTQRMLGRLQNLDTSYNITTLLEISKKYSHYLILASDIEKYLLTLPINHLFPINKILMFEMLNEKSFENMGIYPLYNKGVWSLYVKTTERTIFYGFSSDNIFDKLMQLNIKVDMYIPTNKLNTFRESGLYICKLIKSIIINNSSLVTSKQYKSIELKPKDICKIPINLSQINNPLCYAICLGEICSQIESQRKDGILPVGFISGNLFAKLIKLIENNSYYYDLALFFTDKELIQSIFDDYQKSYQEVIKEIEIGKKIYWDNFNTKLNLEHKTRMMKILKTKTEEFRKQTITDFKFSHNMWFHCDRNHHTGKFAGSDSRSGSIHNPICGEQHHARDAHVNHMRKQFEDTKNDLAELILNIFTNKIYPVLSDFSDTTGNYNKYLIPYIYHVDHKKDQNKYPILTLISIDSCYSEFYEYQKFFANDLEQNWLMEFTYDIIVGSDGTKYFNIQGKINDKVVVEKSQPYEPLFYSGKEAIWFYWYGGEMNLDGGSHTRQWNECYTDNVSTWTLYYPYYTKREPAQFDIFTGYQGLNATNWYNLRELIYKRVNENYLEKFNGLVRNKSLTIKLKGLMDNLDIWDNIIKNIGKLANIENKISPYSFCYTDKVIRTGTEFSNYKLFYKMSECKVSDEYLIMNTVIFSNYKNAILTRWVNFNKKFIFPETWIGVSGIDYKFFNLIKESIPLITSRYSPSEKEKWTQEMNEILIKILEVSQNSPETFTSFDLLGFIKSVKKSWEDKLSSGTIKGNFKDHVTENLLMLSNGNNVLKTLCI